MQKTLTNKTVTSKKLGRTFVLPNDEEEAAINAGIAADPDTFEVTDAQFKKMRGRPVGSNKTLVHIRLDNDLLERFKATGAGWQTRMNDALRKAAP
jgi:uncharacterized protein (DUF4415 family)